MLVSSADTWVAPKARTAASLSALSIGYRGRHQAPAVGDEDDVGRVHVHQALHVSHGKGGEEPLHDLLLLGAAHLHARPPRGQMSARRGQRR